MTNRCMHAFNSLSSNGIYATVRISGQLCEGSHQRDNSSVRCNRRKTCVSLDKCTRHRSTVVCYCHSLHKSPADKLHGEEVCKCVYIRQHACDPCEVTRLHACMCIPMNDTMHCAQTHVGIVGIRATRGVFLGEVVMDHVEALRPMSSVWVAVTVSLCACGMRTPKLNKATCAYRHAYDERELGYNNSRYSVGPLQSCADCRHCYSFSTHVEGRTSWRRIESDKATYI